MWNQLRYGAYFAWDGAKIVLKIKSKIHYDNQLYLDDLHANRLMKEKILSGEPFMACRMGSGEMRTFRRTLEVRWGLRKELPEETLDSICINAGFFPRDRGKVMDFGRLMEESCKQVDLIGVWDGLAMENYVYNTYVKQAKRCYLAGLEPFFCGEPWTYGLTGKRVLVIHPFEESIQRQYSRREQLFQNPDILPEFTLLTLKAVQTIAGQRDERFDDWFQALDYMTEEALKKEFDVAIIGCGAYGFPLAARLKQAGKQAIHMGGATQLLFGIRGNRWDAKEEYQSLINDAWCRPTDGEKPKSAEQVENQCYW